MDDNYIREAEKCMDAEPAREAQKLTLRKSELEAMFAQFRNDTLLEKGKKYYLLNDTVYEVLYSEISAAFLKLYLRCESDYKEIASTHVKRVSDPAGRRDTEYHCLVFELEKERYLLSEFDRMCVRYNVPFRSVCAAVRADFTAGMTLTVAKEKYLARTHPMRFFVNAVELAKIKSNYAKYLSAHANNALRLDINDYIRETLMQPELFDRLEFQMRAHNIISSNLAQALVDAEKALRSVNNSDSIANKLSKLNEQIEVAFDCILLLSELTNTAAEKTAGQEAQNE